MVTVRPVTHIIPVVHPLKNSKRLRLDNGQTSFTTLLALLLTNWMAVGIPARVVVDEIVLPLSATWPSVAAFIVASVSMPVPIPDQAMVSRHYGGC